MSFHPQVVAPEDHLSHIALFKFPQDSKAIARLSLAEKQVWYAAQDPQELIQMTANQYLHRQDMGTLDEKAFARVSEFQKFWRWNYLFPLKMKRFLYWFKFW